MFRLTTKNLWAHKLRFALTGLAVILGVAFMAGTMILTDKMENTFNGIFETANSGTDVIVQSQPGVTAEFGGETRERLPAETLAAVKAVDGVAAAEGTISGFAQLVKADGTTGSLDGLGATIGTNWIYADELNPFDLSLGRAPEGVDEVVLDNATLDNEGWELGDTITVLSAQAPRSLTIVGAASFGKVDGIPGSSLVAVSDTTAQELFGEAGKYDAVMVSATNGTDSAELATSIDAALGAGSYDVVTGEADTAEKQSQFQKDMSFFNTFLMAFAYISLFVGTFIIYNTFSIVVAQRTKDMAMLRAIGASRRQLLGSVLIESTVVGLFAAGIGLGVGVLLSHGLWALLEFVGLEAPDGPTVVTSATVVTALVVGVTITVLSAIAPAVRASRVKPIAALRDVGVDRSASSVKRTIVGLAITGAGLAAFASGVVGGGGTSAMSMLGLGAVGTIIGTFVLGPVIARPVMSVLGVPVRLVSGTAGRLAMENATRNPRRTAATASTLTIGVALVAFITILAASTKASVADAVDKSFRADYVVDSGAWGDGGFSPAIEGTLAGVPEVEAMSPVRSSPVGIDGEGSSVSALNTSVIDQLVELEVSAGSATDLTTDEVAVLDSTAKEQGLALGDSFNMTWPKDGEQEMTVAAIFDEEISGTPGSYIVDLGTFEAHVTDQFDLKVFVAVADNSDVEATTAAIEAALAAFPNAEVLDQATFKASITSEIDMMLNLIYGLLALAVVIALIGIANTLALSIHERTRELGLLRAVGMSRGQLRTAVRWESVLIALLGTGLGTLIAVGGAWGIVRALADKGVAAFVVPGTQMLVIIGLASLAGVVAALGPARRAARLNVLRAIATD